MFIVFSSVRSCRSDGALPSDEVWRERTVHTTHRDHGTGEGKRDEQFSFILISVQSIAKCNS